MSHAVNVDLLINKQFTYKLSCVINSHTIKVYLLPIVYNIPSVSSIALFFLLRQTPLARRRRFVSIRNEIRDARHDGTVTEREDSTSVHYLASQYLADSSLSTDISQFDFGASAATVTHSSIWGSGSRSRIFR